MINVKIVQILTDKHLKCDDIENSTNSKQSTDQKSAKEQSKEPIGDAEVERRKKGRSNK